MTEPSAAASMITGQLLTNNIYAPAILQAMTSVRREDFLPARLQHCAYVDEDLDIGGGRFLMEPLVFARLIDMAAINRQCRVLSIGVLQGYSAIVLSRLAEHVTGTELEEQMVAKARENLQRYNAGNVQLHTVKSLTAGYKKDAPYDVIVINGAIDFVPEELGAQLAMGGRLVAVHQETTRPDEPMGLGKTILVKRISNQLQYREYSDAFTALLPGVERDR
ncbi:MAG: protein-L-isoaspartate O-methyltransferase, partial [Alphaproteobacteria bacterium]